MFGNHGLGGLPEEGAHGKSPKCLGGNLGDFGEFCKGLKRMKSTDIQTQSFLAHFQRIVNAENFVNRFFAQVSASFRGMGNRIRKRTHAT
ncbi:TPA: hypothetical protein ACTRJT_002095 [Neisseria meningitidis]